MTERAGSLFQTPSGPPGKLWIPIAFMAALCVPGIVLRWTGTHPEPWLGAVVFGIGILAAAFLLSWAAETAEMDISQGLALAIIAVIAVLPEYAVDAVLAWKAGSSPEEAEKGLAVANMTGGNRLLIGIGWPVVFALFYYRTRLKNLIVSKERSLELVFLAVATAYVILIPLRDHISLADTIVLVTIFIIYMIFLTKMESEEVVLLGPARVLGALPTIRRRVTVLLVLAYAAWAIIAAAEPFAESLVELGGELGISEFFLIQWLAPLASESPEVMVAGLLAWRGGAAAGMGVLISSKVNQWTLLIGTLPVAFALSAGEFSLLDGGLPLDDRQREEIFLTAAQSAFAIAVFVNLRMSRFEAATLFVLFATQLAITDERFRVIYAFAYALLCVVLLVVNRRSAASTVRTAVEIMKGAEAEKDAEHT